MKRELKDHIDKISCPEVEAAAQIPMKRELKVTLRTDYVPFKTLLQPKSL